MRTTQSQTIEGGPGPSRRDLLKLGGLGAIGLGLPSSGVAGVANPDRDGSVILLMMVGGPSQLETFDPKPDAPSEVRGPFRSIATAIPGVRVVEHLPEIARRMGRLTLIRSLNHQAAPIHETGFQLIGTGQLCRLDADHPHLGSIAANRLGAMGGMPPFVILPGPIGNTGVSVPRGQSSGPIGPSFEPFAVGDDPSSDRFDPVAVYDRARRFLDGAENLVAAGAPSRSPGRAFDLSLERDSVRQAYGRTSIGQSCLMARRLVESGVRVVVVNMFETVFGQTSWDVHGASPFSNLNDYARELLPAFDRAFSSLVDDLGSRGMLDSTMVVATGEFGRSPRLNASGGRDHWPAAWSALLAGGGSAGGRVIGSTDRTASEPTDRPVAPADLFATMSATLGLSESGPGLPILEVFA